MTLVGMVDSLKDARSLQLAALCFSVLALAIAFVRSKKSKPRLPPGPPADPIIGHLRIMPLDYAWRVFADWGKTCGAFIRSRVFSSQLTRIGGHLTYRLSCRRRHIRQCPRKRHTGSRIRRCRSRFDGQKECKLLRPSPPRAI